MRRHRAAILTAGIAAGAVAGGLVGALGARRAQRTVTERLLSELPPEDLGPVASFDGTRLAVRAAGDHARPALIFVHGFSLDMTIWYRQWTALSEGYRCILFDQRAHGRSSRPASGDYSVSALGRDLWMVLDAVGPSAPAVLIGHSMGAMAILSMAEQRPESFGPRVAGAVFAGAAASDLLRGALRSAGARLQRGLWPRLPSLLAAARRFDGLRRHVVRGTPGVGHLVARLTNFGPDAPPDMVDYVAELSARAPIRVWTDGLPSLVDTDLRHAAGHVTVPSTVVVGTEDRVTPPAAASALADLLPAADFVEVDGAGHMAMLERPEEFNRVVRGLADRVLDGGRQRPGGPGQASETDA